jgi:predicted Mrr-cat superfamily restriction endonuclease
MTYWQIASGDGTVDLEAIFLKLNVALIGPGDLGDYFDHRDEYLAQDDGYLVRAFCEEVLIGDIFILKRMVNPRNAEWDIKAVGKVVGGYRYEPIFECVDVSRWQMQHCRRVHWVVPQQPIRVTGGGAPVRIQRCDDSNVLVTKARELFNG